MRKDLLKKHFSHLDYGVIALALLLTGAGLIFIYSATQSAESVRKIAVQALAAVLGIGLMLALSFVDYRVFSYKCILFFVVLPHSPRFILNKISKLINFKILKSLFEHSEHF